MRLWTDYWTAPGDAVRVDIRAVMFLAINFGYSPFVRPPCDVAPPRSLQH
jgi:hypothetical protein